MSLQELRNLQRKNRNKARYYFEGQLGTYRKLEESRTGRARLRREERRYRRVPLAFEGNRAPLAEHDKYTGGRPGHLLGNTGSRGPWKGVTNAVHEVARRLATPPTGLGQFQLQRPLRFVKLLGAGGNGFAALFDTRAGLPPQGPPPPVHAPGTQPWAARVPSLFQGPTHVNYYVCKGVIVEYDEALDWGRPGPVANDPQAEAKQNYRASAKNLREERDTQLALAGSLHIVQAYGAAHRRQLNRLRLNHTTRAVATRVDAQDRRTYWAGRRGPTWTRRTKRGASSFLAHGVVGGPAAPRVPPAPPPPSPAPPPPVGMDRNIRAPPPPYNQDQDIPHTYGKMGTETDLLFLEYLPRGDLYRYIAKGQTTLPLNQNPPTPPNRVLWGMWECMVKMLIPMDRPPRRRRQRMNQDLFAPLESERYPLPTEPEDRERVANIIHFDIDPQNIFLGSFDCTGVREQALPQDPIFPPNVSTRERNKRRQRDHPTNPIPPVPVPTPAQRKDGHGHTPLLKLADFGLSYWWQPSDKTKYIWSEQNETRAIIFQSSRFLGKGPYLTPEQFSQEWEYVDREPITQEEADARAANPALQTVNPGTIVQIAGQYGWKSNLYQLALSMACIITGRSPPSRPLATKIARVITTPTDGNRTRTDTKTRRTFGGWLLDDAYLPGVDRELRETLALCLCQFPQDRPDHDELTAQINEKMAYYNAVHEHATANPPPAGPFAEPAPNLPGGAPPSELANPDLDHTRNWAEARAGDPPRVGVISTAAYDTWLSANSGRGIWERVWKNGRWQMRTKPGPYIYSIGLEGMEKFQNDPAPCRWTQQEIA